MRMVVTIDRSQRVYLNDKPVNIHEIGRQIASQSKDVAKAGGVRALRRNGAVRKLGDGGGRPAPVRHPKYQRGDATA